MINKPVDIDNFDKFLNIYNDPRPSKSPRNEPRDEKNNKNSSNDVIASEIEESVTKEQPKEIRRSKSPQLKPVNSMINKQQSQINQVNESDKYKQEYLKTLKLANSLYNKGAKSTSLNIYNDPRPSKSPTSKNKISYYHSTGSSPSHGAAEW